MGRVVTISSILFLLFYFFYITFADYIHNFYPPTDPNAVLWWVQSWLPHKGIELQVMFIITIFFILLSFVAFKYQNRIAFLNNRYLQFLSFLTTFIVILQTKSYSFTPIPNLYFVLWLIIFLSAILFLLYKIVSHFKKDKLFLEVFFFCIWILFAVFVLTSIDQPLIIDYSYFIGPALKLLQGEPVRSFYMQYDLFSTLIFGLMLNLKMRIWQMQITLGLIYICWFFFYYIFISKFLKEKFLLLIFVISLMLFKYFANGFDIFASPQVLPPRLDLWIILAIIFYKFGTISKVTTFSFGLAYLLNNTFGTFYLILYLIFFSYEVYKEGSIKMDNINYRKIFHYFLILSPIIVCLAIQYYFFGSFISSANKLYSSAQISFINLSSHSLLWMIIAALPYMIFILSKTKKAGNKKIYLFLFGILSIQLIYFFGRSHDNNLLNISGIFIVILFLTFSEIIEQYKIKSLIFFSAAAFFICSNLLFAENINNKISRSIRHISERQLINQTDIEKFVDNHPDLLDSYENKNKIVIINDYDSYFNYRFNLKQIGFFTPFYSHVYIDETLDYLISLMQNDYKVIFFEEWGGSELIEQLNKVPKMKSLGLKFEIIRNNSVFEVNLKKVPANLY